MWFQGDELDQALKRYAEQRGLFAKGQLLATAVSNSTAQAFYPERALRDDGCIVVVQSVDALHRCRDVLLSSSVIGIDVERHSLRSYRAYTCLLQLGTAARGGHAFLVDCLSLPWEEVRSALTDIIECTLILKVFHAAGNDMLWLYQDFGIMPRCVLDTQVLCRCIGSPCEGLTEQWAVMCNVHASRGLKQRLQLSDWRRRPLAPLQMLYAAADAYLLLPIAGTLLCMAELLMPELVAKVCLEGAPRKPPPAQVLVPGDTGPYHEWRSAQALVVECRPDPGLRLWQDLAHASERAGARAQSISSSADETACGTVSGAGLRRAVRRNAPSVTRAQVDAIAEWRRQAAESANESPQWLVPDELLARALACRTRVEAESALSGVVVLEPPESSATPTASLYEGLEGDDEQVAMCAHLDTGLSERLESLLAAVREGQELGIELPCTTVAGRGDEAAQHAADRWWLPFRGPEDYEAMLGTLPATQQARVLREPLRKRARFLSFIRRVAAKGPVYENCTILDPSGQALCTVDSKKLSWYVKRGLADHVDKRTIRLRFEPRGRFGIAKNPASNEERGDEPTAEDAAQLERRERFYTSFKENRCSACASDQNLARYNIVPSCFRKFLPMTHQPGTHDVLLLCIPCHHRASLEHGQKVKQILAARVGLQLDQGKPAKRDPRRAARASALGLLKGGDHVPQERAVVVFQRILDEWANPRVEGDDGLTRCGDDEASFQRFAADLRARAPRLCAELVQRRPDAVLVLWRASAWTEGTGGRRSLAWKKGGYWERNVGEQVVRAWTQAGKLDQLVSQCRAHFVEIIRPQFLPQHWDVAHRVATRNPLQPWRDHAQNLAQNC